MSENNDIKVYNYAAAFIDILGQKKAMEGCSLVPVIKTDEDRDAFISVVRESIGVVITLHKMCQDYFNAYTNYKSGRKELLSADKQPLFEDMKKTNIKFQRFSDGLVVYLSLGDSSIKVPMNGLFGLLATCGSLCLLSLARGKPVRIGIDMAWGSELNENELYGCIIAKSHKLENEIAQYPRAVVGEQLVHYLVVSSKAEISDVFSIVNKQIADLCLEMIAVDEDGYHMIDYLGSGFKKNVATNLEDNKLYSLAYNFVLTQLEKAREEKDSKLGFRYSHLRNYFERNRSVWMGEMGK